MIRLRRIFRELLKYPSAIVGLIMIFTLIAVAAYAVIVIPYDEAVRLWRGGEETWIDNPKNAWPVWYNWFTGKDLPQSVVMDSTEGQGDRTVEQVSASTTRISYDFAFDYPYEDFPREINLTLDSQFSEKPPFIAMTWITPDGREINAGDITPNKHEIYRFAQNERLVRRLDGVSPEKGLFLDPNSAAQVPLQGTYHLRVDALLFEPEGDVQAKMVIYGQVHGWAGTDDRRRDLLVALLWGTPIALSFGLLAAVGTSLSTMIIAAMSTWYGGWFDAIVQRITEVNLILPILSILVMIGTFYSRSIWVMLSFVILLSVFTGGIKTYRAVFLQVKESPYIEAARSYGASNMRIIFRYLIPRIIPLLVPQLVVGVPGFVFLEAALAVLGLGDPVLPTWGKVINDARTAGAVYNGYYYWMLEPAILLALSGLGFSMLGFALDRVFNPRLREI